MTNALRARLAAVVPLSASAEAAARRHLDELTKPPGSLGRLEDLAARLAALRGGAPRVERPVIFTFAADHGVAAEGVSAYPQSVTAQMVENFLAGGAAVNVLARHAGARVVVADFGIAAPLGPRRGLHRRSRGRGTANMALGPAMTRDDALAAIEDGARLCERVLAGELGDDEGDGEDAPERRSEPPERRSEPPELVGIGEMGIANTTAASAITAVLTGADPADVTGRGTGIDADGVRRKIDVVRRAIAVNRPDPADPVGVLGAVGGYEIAGLVGVILAATARRVPVALDGFISSSAALVAARLAPAARDALFASHRSAEPGHAAILDALGLVPYLELGMRLGEGTGAALFVHLARAAARVYGEMATFTSAGVDGPRETRDG